MNTKAGALQLEGCPWTRVEETARVFGHMGAAVTLRQYPGMGYTINFDEIEAARAIIDSAISAGEERAR